MKPVLCYLTSLLFIVTSQCYSAERTVLVGAEKDVSALIFDAQLFAAKFIEAHNTLVEEVQQTGKPDAHAALLQKIPVITRELCKSSMRTSTDEEQRFLEKKNREVARINDAVHARHKNPALVPQKKYSYSPKKKK